MDLQHNERPTSDILAEISKFYIDAKATADKDLERWSQHELPKLVNHLTEVAKNLEKKLNDASAGQGSTPTVTPPEDEDDAKKLFKPSIHEFKPYAPSIVGLLNARNDCRMEMVKIVNEVCQCLLLH